MSTNTYSIDDMVCGGAPGTEDYDEGRVLDVDGELVTVGWRDGEKTTVHHGTVRPLGAPVSNAQIRALRALVGRYQHPSHSAAELVEMVQAGAVLYRLDSGSAGEDDILVGEEAEVLAAVCAHHEVEALPEGWSLDRIWPAED